MPTHAHTHTHPHHAHTHTHTLTMHTRTHTHPHHARTHTQHDVNVEEKSIPLLLRCTGQKLAETGAYLVENGLVIVVWLGQHLSNEFISKVFGVGSLAQVNPDLVSGGVGVWSAQTWLGLFVIICDLILVTPSTLCRPWTTPCPSECEGSSHNYRQADSTA